MTADDLRMKLQMDGFFHPVYKTVSCDPHTDDRMTCENPFLFTLRYFHMLEALGGEPTMEEIGSFSNHIGRCQLNTPGNFVRYPGATSRISQDELVAIAAYSGTYGMKFAAENIFSYGSDHDWAWPDVSGETKWTLSGWLGRHLYFEPFIRICAGKEVGLTQQALWALSTIACTRSGYEDTSGKLLQWDQIQTIEKIGGQHRHVMDAAIGFWKTRIADQYPGGAQEMLRIFFPKWFKETV